MQSPGVDTFHSILLQVHGASDGVSSNTGDMYIISAFGILTKYKVVFDIIFPKTFFCICEIGLISLASV